MRTVLRHAEVPVLVAVPLVLALCALFQFDQTGLLTLLVAATALVVFFANFEASRPALRQVVPAVVLGALAAAGRIIFAPVPDFKPVSAIAVIAGVVFGKRSGFIVGAFAALISNFFFGQGPWTPWQMYAWGMVGYLAGVLGERGAFTHSFVLYAYGFLSGLFYGFLLNSWYIVGFVHPITWPSALAAYGAGLPWDCVHGVATVVFLAALYAPWRRKLERIRTKFGMAESTTRQP